MKLALGVPILAAGHALAIEWAIDRACNEGDATNGIKIAMKAAVQRAEAAFQAMQTPDDLVHHAVKIIIGDGPDYDSKFNEIRDQFEQISKIPQEPFSMPIPRNIIWQSNQATNPENIEFWCSADDNRFRPVHGEVDWEEGSQLWQDVSVPIRKVSWPDSKVMNRKKCHAGQKISIPPSDAEVDGLGITARIETRIDKTKEWTSDNIIESKRAANIDICKYLRETWGRRQWPTVDRDYVEKTRLPEQAQKIEDGFHREFKDGKFNHFESLVTAEHWILHELFHTKHGGRKQDKGKGDIDCYGFACVVQIHEAINADSMAYLGTMLQLLGWGYMVNSEGVVMKHFRDSN